MAMNALICEGLWKRYRLKSHLLRQLVRSWLRPVRADSGNGSQLWALRDLSLEVTAGETLGLIGNNGSGKSTMLKIIAGVTHPTRGRVTVRGRVGALVEVGAGMHPDLTGHENVYLYGAMLGIPRREIRRKFDSIANFAELEKFLDVPVRRYSSGMKIRLGFAVAAHLDPDILLIDEILAVGDVGFQLKCVNYVQDLHRNGTTIIFVSHDLVMVEQLCERTIWMERGQVKDVGSTHEVIERYREAVDARFLAAAQPTLSSGRGLDMERVVVTDAMGVQRAEFQRGEPITVNLHYSVRDGMLPVAIALKISDDARRTVTMAHSVNHGHGLTLAGRGVVACTFESPPLAPKVYQVWASAKRMPDFAEEIPWQPVAAFAVTGPRMDARAIGIGSDLPLIDLPTNWTVTERP